METPSKLTAATLLLVDDDADILDALTWAVQDAGYTTAAASSLEEALDILRGGVFQLVVTDLLDREPQGGIPLTGRLRREALPTPTGLVTAWKLSVDWPEREAFVFVITKPFDLDDLLSQIAMTLAQPLTPAQERQRAAITRYFSALERRDWNALREVCTADMRYMLDRAKTPVEGLEAYIAYVLERVGVYPHFRFPHLVAHPLPVGIAIRFFSEWDLPDGSIQHGSGGVIFRFVGEQIAQVGVSSPSTLPLRPNVQETDTIDGE